MVVKEKVILHLTPTDIRYDGRILKELKALESLENTILKAFGIDDDEGHKYDINPPSYIRTFRIYSKKFKILPRPLRYFVNLLEAIIKLTIPAIKCSPKIIHCHDTLYLPIALIVKFFCNSKLIYDAHELESDKAGQSKALSKYTFFIEKIAWKKIDLLISVSPSIIDWYDKHLGEKLSILILNSPSLENDSRKRQNTNYLREKFQIPPDKMIFLYLGIISEKGRGVELYLNIFQKKTINSHIVFIGYGDYADEVKKVSERECKVHYHPAVPHNQVVEVAKAADVGLCMIEAVSLSDYYCLPNKLFEYAFSDIYILASDFPDIKHFVKQYSLGRCCKLDENLLYYSIKEIESNEIKKNNINLYPLSWQYQAEQLLKGYNILLII